MTGHQINSLVGDLVAMAQAMERLPLVEAELSKAHADIETYANKAMSIALDLEQSKTYAATLEQKVRDTEAARDDAELRFLEAEDRTEKALAFVRTMFGNAGSLIQALEPPKPEPVPGVQPAPVEHTASGWNPNVEQAPQGQGAMDPTSALIQASNIEAQPQPSWAGQDTNATSAASSSTEGQGEALPTAPMPLAETEVSSIGNSPSSASAQEPITTENQKEVGPTTTSGTQTGESSEPAKPYANLLYHNYPGYVSRHDWIEGGGTDETYDYRPAEAEPFPGHGY